MGIATHNIYTLFIFHNISIDFIYFLKPIMPAWIFDLGLNDIVSYIFNKC
jgi:hypothetical protein